MIIDCITFFNENELFELRYELLKDIVDKFIVIEAKYTHSGVEKGFNFKFSDYDKVQHGYITHFSNSTPWGREREQRETILELLKMEKAQPDDLIIVSDADEIPNPNNIRPGFFVQKMFYHYMNTEAPYPWVRSFCLRYKDISKPLTEIRNFSTDVPLVSDGGWHFSWLGDSKDKLVSFAHTEFDTPEATSKIMQYKKKLKDVHGAPLEVVEPPSIIDTAKYANHIYYSDVS